ncbi:MAG: hypothetical protein EOO99_01575 [Pedobacter sp.]|jgi:hypothetical protein|nr:MAG: hypothetical protein EOO99_01575 [Pedobacter sp.]
MVKTSTSLNFSDFADPTSTEQVDSSQDLQNELFLNSIQWQLDNLKREPSAQVIQSILDYAQAK